MNRKGHSGVVRFTSSALIALPLTVALIFLMTHLILPGEHDSIVTRMIQDIELQQIKRVSEPIAYPVFAPPPARPKIREPDARETLRQRTLLEKGSEKEEPANSIDWWGEVRKMAGESDQDRIDRWLIEQGFERYVSIMQGPLPITNSVHAALPPTQEDKTGYMNTYGDMEIKISEHCVATTQVAARLDISDFAKALPMRVTCKIPKQVFSFERE